MEARGGRGGSCRARAGLLLPAVLVAVVVSPVVVGAFSLIGDTWRPLNDWASLLFRTSQVGTGDTPLVGPYSHSWAHPGPVLLWIAAPLYRLTGGEPLSLMWTATLLNAATIVALGAVAWRRGRWPLLLAVMAFVSVFVHGLGPEIVNDLWNPFAAVLPFVLTVFLVWDAALGRRRALLEALVPATFAAQSHVAFVLPLLTLAAWFVVREVRPDPRRALPRLRESLGATWRSAGRLQRTFVVVVVVLWLGPLYDAVFDLHNPVGIMRTAGGYRKPRIGPVEAVGVVGRYVRPDGPWSGGPEPERFGSIVGSGPLPLLLALGLLAGCAVLGRRRGLSDVTALATMMLALVVVAVPATSRILLPAHAYLTTWLCAIGGLVWFTIGWTAWRVAAPAVCSQTARRWASAGLCSLVVVGVTASSWPAASRWTPPRSDLRPVLDHLRAQLADELPHGRRYRVEVRGDGSSNMRGLILWMIEDGYDVVASDGAAGLKWGHEHRWESGDEYHALLVVAVHEAGAYQDAYADCVADPGAGLVAGYDRLSASERAWFEDYFARTLAGEPPAPADRQRADSMGERNFRVGVFEAAAVCTDQSA